MGKYLDIPVIQTYRKLVSGLFSAIDNAFISRIFKFRTICLFCYIADVNR